MSEKGNADTNRGEKKMEGGEDSVSVRTMDCLRGRLLAERAASRNAEQQTHQLRNKLMELENLLKQEAKSRKRAEKKLKSLMKKLESINIPYASDESEYSSFMDKSDISSISSTSIFSNHLEENQESKENVISQQNDSLNSLSSLSGDSFKAEDISISAFEIQLKRQEYETGRTKDASSPEIFRGKTTQNIAIEDSLSSANDEHSDKSSPRMDEQSDIWHDQSSIRSSSGEEDAHCQIDDSMALVLVETTQENHTIDPEVLDGTVKEVLGALRYAKEQLQSSMERRRTNMIRVG